ncbi:MAG: cell division protein FtsH, partial [Pseudanabaenaceae cyanobacterium]
EIVFGEAEVTTGASSDLQQVARIARQMIARFGMSDVLGPVSLGRASGNMFLGRELGAERDFSEETAATIDEEVKKLVDHAYTVAKTLLTQNRSLLDRITQALIERETIDAEELQTLIEESEVNLAGVVG